MCGVVRTNSSDSELVVAPQDVTGMPPSVTVGGNEASKVTPPAADVPCHIMQQQGAVSNREIPTIDLADESDDLQKAIELSLQEQPQQAPLPLAGLTAEEQDVSKALEVSLQDTSSVTTVDNINPQDRKRVKDIPVGLKNIGNSCWFNVVIQPLFFIPVFRDMIISYPKDIEDEDPFSKLPIRHLVPTLRQLFCLMIASDKKYVDPSEAVNLFQGQEMRKNTQQDVCEFIHKLLEKLEEAFKLLLKKQGIEKECSESSISKEGEFEKCDFKNPIMKLFYGHTRRESSEESGGTKLETFGQYPLTVMKYKDIHESILASMSGGTAEDNIKTSVKPVKQETWFKTLPSVLIFSLSRYEFSKEKNRAEKVHNKFDFPQYLFMDRYMEVNKEIVKEKHLKIAKIKQNLNSLYCALEKYQKFGSGEARYPIADILKYALEFAGNMATSNEANATNPSIMEVDGADLSVAEADIEMVDEKERNSVNKNIDLANESQEVSTKDVLQKSSQALTANRTQEEFVQISPNRNVTLLAPAPNNISQGELEVLQDCLPRWQKEVEMRVSHLKKAIEDLEEQLRLMFEETELHHIPYKLHAVVVHEGQASGGHYWVYIYDSFTNVWMKFNDIQVSESNWQELLQDSIGGQNNASAYCLMYIDETRYDLLFSSHKPTTDNLQTYLPLDLQEYVKQDNILFASELEEWELKQEQQMSSTISNTDALAVPSTAPNSPEIFSLNEEETNFFLDIQTMLSETLLKQFQNEDQIIQERNKPQWLHNIVHTELRRLKEFATHKMNDDRFSEPSVLDLGIYLTKNSQSEILLQWYAYEIVWHVSHSRNTKGMNIIREEAVKILQQILDKYMSSYGPTFQGWKKHYQNYVACTWYFICGFRKMQVGHHDMALVHMMQALKLHRFIKENPPGLGNDAKTLDFRVLGHCHRKCLQSVNDKLVDSFLAADSEGKAMEVAQSVNRFIVPALWFVNSSNNKDDELTCEIVRNRWCQTIDLLSQNKPKSQLIKQIIEVVMSEGSDTCKFALKVPCIPPVLSLYKEYNDSVSSLMRSEKKDTQTSDL